MMKIPHWRTAFDDLPVLRYNTAQPMDDDDVDFHSDILYFRGLREHIIERICCDNFRPQPLPLLMSLDLDAALTCLRAIQTPSFPGSHRHGPTAL